MIERTVPVLLAMLLAGCASSEKGEEDDLLADPFHDTFAGANRVYTENPVVEWPTAAGNGLFWFATSPIWGAAMIAEDTARDDGAWPVAKRIMFGAAYGGGAALGTPFLGLYWGLFRWWWDLLQTE